MEHRILFNKWLYRRLPYFLRKKLTPPQAPFVIVVVLAFAVILLQLLMLLTHNDEIEVLEHKLKNLQRKRPRPLAKIIGIDPKFKHKYVPNHNNMFQCLDSNIEIPFEWVNDDYCDCLTDGSDEPATGACQINHFYCSHR